MRTSPLLRKAFRPNVPLITAAGALALLLSTAGAQAADLPEVTVSAPASKVIGRDVSGAPIHQVNATARVRYNPIMLTTHSGRALLHYKIVEVAQTLCREINTVALAATDNEGTCVQRAVNGTKMQIAAAVAKQTVG